MDKIKKENVVDGEERENDPLSIIDCRTIRSDEFNELEQGIDEKNEKSIVKPPYDVPEGMSFAGVINCEENIFYPFNIPSKEETKKAKEPRFRPNILKQTSSLKRKSSSLVEEKKDEKEEKDDENVPPIDIKMVSQLLRMVLKSPWKIIESNNLTLIHPGIGSKPLTKISILFPAKLDVYLENSLIDANHPFWNKCTETKLHNKQLRIAYILQVVECVQRWIILDDGNKIVKRDWKNRVLNYVYEKLQEYRNKALNCNENDYTSYLFCMKTKERLKLGIRRMRNGKFNTTEHFKELRFLNLHWNDIREIFCEKINYGAFSNMSEKKVVNRFETTNRIINKWNNIMEENDILTISPWRDHKDELPADTTMRLELGKNVGKIQTIRRNLKENCKFFNYMYTEALLVDAKLTNKTDANSPTETH